MKAGSSKIILIITGLLHFSVLGYSQNKGGADSLVRLIEAVSAELIEKDSVSYRKITGPATFLHNDTYLKCDTALWNVSTNIIDAVGNVQIIQENTMLTSDSLKYDIPASLAMFRGSLVELYDKEGNILNTNYLNYNTRDSIATFYFGASMKSNDGKIMESDNGSYLAAEKKFSFEDNVQIFTDSVLMVSSQVDYLTETDFVVFNENTVAWRNENMLFANSGNFNRPRDIFTLDKDGYVFTREQELWADLLHYYRAGGNADLYDNVQVLDTVQSAICLADKVMYRPSEHKIELSEKPAVGMYSVENDVPDTLFLAADLILYRTRRMHEVDSLEVVLAKERVKLSEVDPIALHDQERRAARQKEKNADKEIAPGTLAPAEQDSLIVRDTLAVPVAAQIDTSEVAFIDAFHNVRFHRSDIQGVCDSLVYTGLDSMARFYGRPAMWYNSINQFTADSIQGVLKNRCLQKVNLLSNAFIAIQEDTVHYNQIKSAEMMAFFSSNELYRFDALGGVSAIFYMEEDSTITLMDKEECKMMTARISNNEIRRTRSIGDLSQNVFPVFNLPVENQRLKGFQWRGAERPRTRQEVTHRKIRKSFREKLDSVGLPEFIYTHKYFPDAMPPVMDYRQYVIEGKRKAGHQEEGQQ